MNASHAPAAVPPLPPFSPGGLSLVPPTAGDVTPFIGAADARLAGLFRAGGAQDVLDAIAAFANFLLDAEADAICGVKRRTHSDKRVNFRAGYHRRMLKLRAGTVHVRAPNLRFLHVRPSMAKRFRRHEPALVGIVSYALRGDPSLEQIGSLIAELWTVELPLALLADLVSRSVALFDACRRTIVLREALAALNGKAQKNAIVAQTAVHGSAGLIARENAASAPNGYAVY